MQRKLQASNHKNPGNIVTNFYKNKKILLSSDF